MAEKIGKKKKLIVKKKSKGKSIANQIVKKQKEQETQKANEIEAKKQAEAKKIAQEQQAKKEVKPKVTFEEQKVEKPKQNKPAQTNKPKGKKSKGKSNLREDILRQEEHKKFFLKQQQQGKPKKDSAGPASSIPKKIKITEYTQVGELARKLNVKTSEVIAKLMKMGEMVTITQSIDAETATLVCGEYGTEVEVISLYDETVIQEEPDQKENIENRPPVVTIMGHVDHGKTKLLDALREADVVSTEAGGITQHIGAYQITTATGKKITFLDTPGHEAFTAMRARGANLTDIVVLVVAADDGVMPQTVEAIHHAKEAKVPIVVAINKIDLETANVEKIKQEVSKYDLVPEEWGGSTPFVNVSALQKQGLDKLEEIILASAELLELGADSQKRGNGIVIEAKLDQGRGSVATLLVINGTLKVGDPCVVGLEGGRVRAMMDDKGRRIKAAGPGTPVEILGLSGVPNAGDPFHVMPSEKEAKDIVEKRQELNRRQQAQKIKKVKLENLNEYIQEGQIQELKIIIKADVQGSVEAIQQALEKLSNQEIKVNVIFGGTGEISESDIMLASAANAIIIAFNTRAGAKVRDVAGKEGIEIKFFNIIYQVIDEITDALSGMLTPDVEQELLGEAEVRQIFKISNLGQIAGSMVTSGSIFRNKPARVIREGAVIFDGALKTLKRFQDDANEVKEGFECGILLENFNDIKVGDIVESYQNKEISRSIADVKSNDQVKGEAAGDE